VKKLLILPLVLVLFGCPCGAERNLVEKVDEKWGIIKGDYKKLLDEKSGYLPDTIRIRKENCDQMDRALEDLKKALK